MKIVVKKIKLVLKLIRSFFPEQLPVGVTAFKQWSTDIIEVTSFLSGSPDNDSVRFALGTMIPHVPASSAYRSKFFFVRTLLKSMSNQVAYTVIQELKAKQQEEIAKAEAADTSAAAGSPIVGDKVLPV